MSYVNEPPDPFEPGRSTTSYSRAEILTVVNRLRNENEEDRNSVILSGNHLAEMIYGNPESLIGYLSPNEFLILTELLQVEQTQRSVLFAFNCILPFLKDFDKEDIIALLSHNQFCEILAWLIDNAADVERSCTAISCACKLLPLGDEFLNLMSETDIVSSILALTAEDDILLHAKGRFLRDSAYYIKDGELRSSILQHILEMVCDHDTITQKYGLQGLYGAMEANGDGFACLLADTSIINRFAESLLSKCAEVRNAAAYVILYCVQYPDFPMGELFKYGVVENLIRLFEWDDESELEVCVSIFKQWLRIPDRPYLIELLDEMRKRNLYRTVQTSLFSVKLMFLEFCQFVVETGQDEHILAICHPEFLELMIDYVRIEDLTVSVSVVSVLRTLVERIEAIDGCCGKSIARFLLEKGVNQNLKSVVEVAEGDYDSGDGIRSIDCFAEWARSFSCDE
jgi:hypothetical protein